LCPQENSDIISIDEIERLCENILNNIDKIEEILMKYKRWAWARNCTKKWKDLTRVEDETKRDEMREDICEKKYINN
jgi:hypothetical protein